ncbi:MFS transporter [Staphylococcus kloosii]|uniref:MFS transporter n=1 Tax=Staphylococcus kloosii TaxID=29384 RepID=UPI0028A428ED|nr:MFS transporter [Staphylococcus kloosii]MDT3959795.1 MFS transporter [Staphylococcus kloosii]
MKKLSINIHIRLWGSFINRLISSAIFPFMAIYLTDITNSLFASIFLSAVVFFSFILNMASGYIIDLMPRKKILTISSIGESFSLLMLYIGIIQTDVYFFISAYLLYIIFSSLRRPSLTVILQDSVTKENRDFVYRIDYWLINLSLALGAFLGGAFYDNKKEILFLLSFLSTTLITLVYIFLISESSITIRKVVNKNVFKDFILSYTEVLKDKKFVLMTIGMLIIFSAELSTNSYVSVRLHNSFQHISILGIDITGARMFSYLSMTNTLVVVTFTLVIGYITAKIKTPYVLISGLAFYTIGYTVNFFANEWWILIMFMVVASIGELMYAPITNSKMIDLIPSTKRGAYNSFYSLSSTGAELIARLTILFYPLTSPLVISLFYFVFLILGSILVYRSLFFNAKLG